MTQANSGAVYNAQDLTLSKCSTDMYWMFYNTHNIIKQSVYCAGAMQRCH